MISKEMLPVQAVLKMIYSLSTKGIPVIAEIGPIIHQINDFELEPLVKHVADLGVKKSHIMLIKILTVLNHQIRMKLSTSTIVPSRQVLSFLYKLVRSNGKYKFPKFLKRH
ncbi:MAG: hypothetical protein IPK61_08940 [Saprospiraceae bacterium]|nr:hypothetical protein [Saprospiraceae bacterium]